MKQIKGLRIDWENVEGDVRLPEEFTSSDNLGKLDILKDWIGCLQAEYDKTFFDWRREYADIRAKLSKAKK